MVVMFSQVYIYPWTQSCMYQKTENVGEDVVKSLASLHVSYTSIKWFENAYIIGICEKLNEALHVSM